MDWYYANESNEQVAIRGEEMATLVRRGTIRPDTLVWNEEMTDWKPCREVKPEWFSSEALPPVAMPPSLPPSRQSPGEPTDTLSLSSLILGICGLAFMACYGAGFPFSIAAVICGHLARRRFRAQGGGSGEGMALAGLITGYIGLGIFLIIVVVVAVAFLFIGFESGTVAPTPEAVP